MFGRWPSAPVRPPGRRSPLPCSVSWCLDPAARFSMHPGSAAILKETPPPTTTAAQPMSTQSTTSIRRAPASLTGVCDVNEPLTRRCVASDLFRVVTGVPNASRAPLCHADHSCSLRGELRTIGLRELSGGHASAGQAVSGGRRAIHGLQICGLTSRDLSPWANSRRSRAREIIATRLPIANLVCHKGSAMEPGSLVMQRSAVSWR